MWVLYFSYIIIITIIIIIIVVVVVVVVIVVITNIIITLAAYTPPAGEKIGSGIPTLEQLREKKKPGSTLPNNFVFSSKGTISYESLDLPDFVNGFLEFQKQQADACKPGLTKHLQ